MMNYAKRYQTGVSLMEVLIAMSISLVVTASMIALMANSLSTTARIVKMTKLADDLRVTMQMMTRDVRRSSYNANSMYCYANGACALGATDPGDPDTIVDLNKPVVDSDGTTILTLAGAIDFVDEDDDDFDDDQCFTFLMDRGEDGNSINDDAGGFRLRPDPDTGMDAIEMWNDPDASPNCASAPLTGGWVQITDPGVVEITGFDINDEPSYTEVIQTNDIGTPILSQVSRKFRINLTGRLVLDNDIERQIEDVISVRNDILLAKTET
jgi:type II secretory pathway pseudopilin PulG